MTMKLYVGNLSFETSKDDLQTMFAQGGYGRKRILD